MPTPADFTAQRGGAQPPGLLTQAALMARLPQGQNPYVTGPGLPAGSPMFFGRRRELDEILGLLRCPERPGCVSLLGERRIGKTGCSLIASSEKTRNLAVSTSK